MFKNEDKLPEWATKPRPKIMGKDRVRMLATLDKEIKRRIAMGKPVYLSYDLAAFCPYDLEGHTWEDYLKIAPDKDAALIRFSSVLSMDKWRGRMNFERAPGDKKKSWTVNQSWLAENGGLDVTTTIYDPVQNLFSKTKW